MRSGLRTYRDASGRELLDVPDGTIVDGGEPAPVRFLPEYDNTFLSHADRARITLTTPSVEQYDKGSLFVDGFGAGSWRASTNGGATVLVIRPFRAFSAAEKADVEKEAQALLAFLAGDPDRASISWVVDGVG
jgi:hypothetical protein